MRPIKLQTISALLLVFFCSRLMAVTAADIVVQLVQPGGTVFNAKPIGDEWNNRMETQAGFTVARDSKGVWRYVTGYGPGKSPLFSSSSANQSAPPGLKKHLSSGSSRPIGAPAVGTQGTTFSEVSLGYAESITSPVLFILVEFDDQMGTTNESSWGDFVGNKVHDFYNKTSHGNANLSPATESSGTSNDGVVGWLNVGASHPDTAGNTGTINRNLTADAIIAADPFVDFSSYDTNGNGYVESEELSVVVIVAGYETAYGGADAALSPSVWGHKWGWSSATAPRVDAVQILEYAQFGEFHATTSLNKHQATMGIMVHELGHLAYGLPDLYDTDYSSIGIGPFGLMASGSWGQSSSDDWAGQTPVSTSAWSKYVLNWVDDLEGSGSVSIESSGTGTSANTVFMASTSNNEQYFLVENRQPTGYDLGLERWLGTAFTGGLAIWHIDNTKNDNTNDSNRLVDLEEADSTETSSSYSTDLWHNDTIFNDFSNPSSKLYNGSDSGVSISVLSTAGLIMDADFGTPTEPLATPTDPNTLQVIDNEDGSATVSWIHDEINLTGFELQRQKAHKKRPNTWTETVVLQPDYEKTDSTSFAQTDGSGTGTFRYLIRAMNQTQGSNWAYSLSQKITGSSTSEPPQQCPVLDGNPAGTSCTSNDQCCSGSCKGKPGGKTCK
jgi:M6 family metalloprotease-like protein